MGTPRRGLCPDAPSRHRRRSLFSSLSTTSSLLLNRRGRNQSCLATKLPNRRFGASWEYVGSIDQSEAEILERFVVPVKNLLALSTAPLSILRGELRQWTTRGG